MTRSYRKMVKTLVTVMADCDLLIISDYLGKTVTAGIFKTLKKEFPEKIALWIHAPICWIFPE